MHYIDKARGQLTDLVGKVVDSTTGGGGNSQTLTVSRSRPEVEQFWRDPENLSEVLGDVAEVRSTKPGSYEWTLNVGADEHTTWNTTLIEGDGNLLFVGSAAGEDSAADSPEIELTFRDAPHDLGTEMTIRAKTPLPDILTGAALFKAIYRARALLQTGELPTLRHNPSARKAAR
ncbi:hypothetical protein [Rhodococcus tibetensis]|uniref:Polyketide cyclase / dehydrase and lipid transport n=1 Tax=Rhodococcus tibetensis TaxID=2965064 RepID=A0ABT1QML4_9NOCA|nr:hypothetical protein [Rhodococcus sp. FXJ9.536]MCQ4122350.1 hypothetical protein [Rhodococcus sp. FXJ9.536]